MRQIQVIGHRGARCYAPENTLVAYTVCLAQGVDMVDIDVVLTQDKVLIAYHDLLINPNILADLDGNYVANSRTELLNQYKENELEKFLIKNHTFAQLQRYQVRLNPKSNYSRWFPKQQYYPDTHIAPLIEVIRHVDILTNKKVDFQIEIKNDFDHLNWSLTPKELAVIIYAFLLEHNLLLRVKIQAFDWRILIELNKLDGRIKTAFLESYQFAANWQRWFADSEIPLLAEQAGLNNSGLLIPLIKSLGGYSYEPEDALLTKENLDLAHSLGLKVIVWGWPENSQLTFNPELINKLLDWQVDGIITDDPQELNRILKQRGYRIPHAFNKVKNYIDKVSYRNL